MSRLDNGNRTHTEYLRCEFVKQPQNKVQLLQTHPNLTKHPKRKISQETHFFLKEINIKIQDGGRARTRGQRKAQHSFPKENRSTKYAIVVIPQVFDGKHLKMRSECRKLYVHSTFSSGHRGINTITAVGTNCRMYTKVVLHKQTRSHQRIQRWWAEVLSGRSGQNPIRTRHNK